MKAIREMGTVRVAVSVVEGGGGGASLEVGWGLDIVVVLVCGGA